MAAGLEAIGVLSAFGPVGILAGRLVGDVLSVEAAPTLLRGPRGAGIPVGEASLGV